MTMKEMMQTTTVKSEVTEPNTMMPGMVDSSVMESDMMVAKTLRPETVEPETTRPDMMETHKTDEMAAEEEPEPAAPQTEVPVMTEATEALPPSAEVNVVAGVEVSTPEEPSTTQPEVLLLPEPVTDREVGVTFIVTAAS